MKLGGDYYHEERLCMSFVFCAAPFLNGVTALCLISDREFLLAHQIPVAWITIFTKLFIFLKLNPDFILVITHMSEDFFSTA